MSSADPSTAGRAALDYAWRGDFEVVERLAGGFDGDPSPIAAAWRTALGAHRWLAEPEAVAAPAVADFETFVGADEQARRAAALGCAAVARACVLAFDREGLEATVAMHARLADGLPFADAAMWLDAGRLWVRALGGEVEGASERASDLSHAASEAKLASVVIELTALRALLALLERDVESATKYARRASRMSRTEALPQQEYLANLILARVRRITGQPHLATRILSALARVVPAHWHGWIAWELRLAGGPSADELSSGQPTSVASTALDEMLSAASGGERDRFEQVREALRDDLSGFRELALEAEVVAVAADPTSSPTLEIPGFDDWSRGGTPTVPFGLHAIAAVPGEGSDRDPELSWVVVGPGRAARRVLHPGLGLLGDMKILEKAQRRQGRLDTAIATLALAGEGGIGLADFFPQVYGFTFARDVHEGVLRVLVHRVRSRLSGLALVHRDGDQLRLEATAPFVVADPRTAAPVGDRVLRLLASRPGVTAKDAAKALEVPLRTVQAELQQLVSDGACNAERQGRKVQYWVEDTTFSEPTVTSSHG